MEENSPEGSIFKGGDFQQSSVVSSSNDSEVRGYILEMVGQLAEIAEKNGETVIAAMLAELLRQA